MVLCFSMNGTPCNASTTLSKIKAGTFLLPAITMSRGSVRVRCGGKPYALSQIHSSWRQGCKFLMLALKFTGSQSVSEWKVVSQKGVAYRNTPNMNDRWTARRGPEFGDLILCVERGGFLNNWIKVRVPDVGFKYLPITKNGEVLLKLIS